jgi:hypothetical protein
LNKKVEIVPSPKISVSMSPYPLPEKLDLYLQEKDTFYLTIENTGNTDVEVVYYSVSYSGDWVSSPAVLWDGTSKTSSLSKQGKKLSRGEILESLPLEIEGQSYGSVTLTVNVYYICSKTGEGYYETLTIPVNVKNENVNKNQAASDAFGVETLDTGEVLYWISVMTDEGYSDYINYGVVVKPTEWGETTKNWNRNAKEISYYKGKISDDLTGAVTPEIVGFIGDVQAITSQNSVEGVQNAGLRAVTPSAIKMGWDLGRMARYAEETKKQDDIIKSVFEDAKFGWAYINGDKTRIMYKTEGDTTYIAKVGVI